MPKMNKTSERERGFTLLEMVCVLALIAMLAAILLPFVPRLAGTADLPVVEYLRAEFILVETAKRILVPAFSDTWDWDSRPRDMSRVTRLDQAYRIAQFIKYNRVEAWDATSAERNYSRKLPSTGEVQALAEKKMRRRICLDEPDINSV